MQEQSNTSPHPSATEALKRCTKCGRYLPHSHFGGNGNGTKRPDCKGCRLTYRKDRLRRIFETMAPRFDLICACGCGQHLPFDPQNYKRTRFIKGHHSRGKPTQGHPTGTPEERFWRKVQKTDDCWLWTGAIDKQGYGVFTVGGRKGRNIGAHRFSYELHKGDIPKDILVCHKCDTPPCVNPDHLFLGTDSDNNWDTVKKGRHQSCKGELNCSAKLTEKNVTDIRHRFEYENASRESLCHDFAISRGQLNKILRRISWRHI